MKIAIIGGGWVGCHLAYKLKNLHDVTIFERNLNLFQETSSHNQNRLHIGFHYARNYDTRELCKTTFKQFIHDYGFCVSDVGKNCYCVADKHSIVDYQTYLKIFNDFEFGEINLALNNIQGCITTDEKYIDFIKASNFFNEELKHLVKHETITKQYIHSLANQFDLVIDCTNNCLEINTQDTFYELTLTLIYEKIKDVEFDSLTIVDGNLFSIYPYQDNKFTVTDVEYTPLRQFNTIEELNKYKLQLTPQFIQETIQKIETKILEYYPGFTNEFKYDSYFLATKTKPVSDSSSRYPVINRDGNIVSCFTGKIQGIYIIEDYIKTLIYEQQNTSLF